MLHQHSVKMSYSCMKQLLSRETWKSLKYTAIQCSCKKYSRQTSTCAQSPIYYGVRDSNLQISRVLNVHTNNGSRKRCKSNHVFWGEHKHSSCRSLHVTINLRNNDHDDNGISEPNFKDDPFVKDILKEMTDDFQESKVTQELDEYASEENLGTSKEDFSTSNDKQCIEDGGFVPLIYNEEEYYTKVFDDLDTGALDDLDTYKDLDEEEVTFQTSYEEIEEFPDSFEREQKPEWVSPIPLTRGKAGVFDVEELVALLRLKKMFNICAIKIPEDRLLGEHMVIVSAKSVRHLRAVQLLVRKIYKAKMRKEGKNKDKMYKVEGDRDKEWTVLDLGNIIVHLFMPEARERYDLETLWTVGFEFDELAKEKGHVFDGLFNADMDWLKALNTVEDLPTQLTFKEDKAIEVNQ